MTVGARLVVCWLCVIPVAAASQTLDLQQYLQLVEAANPSIRSAQYETELAQAEILSAVGRFDPLLNMGITYEDKNGADKLNFFDGSLELPLNMLFGPSIKAGYRRGIGTNANPESVTTLPGEATLGVSLPLFQGIFTDRRRNQLQKALVRPDAAQAQFRIDRNTTLRNAAMSYWIWAEAEAEVSVADSVLTLAVQRLLQIRRRVEAGEQAGIDTVELRQEVLRREGQRLLALRAAEQARVNAGVFLWRTDGTPLEITANPSPLPKQRTVVYSATQSAELALTNRPEVQRMDALQRMARLDSSLAQEFLRPFVKVDAALAAYDVSRPGTLDYKIGLTVQQPLLFRTASGDAEAANIVVQRADLSRSLVERIVIADAQNAVIAAERAQQRLEVAQQEVQLAGEMVQAERQRLDAGDSNLLALNLRERFLAEALLRLVQAQGDAARAEIQLLWATGTI